MTRDDARDINRSAHRASAAQAALARWLEVEGLPPRLAAQIRAMSTACGIVHDEFEAHVKASYHYRSAAAVDAARDVTEAPLQVTARPSCPRKCS